MTSIVTYNSLTSDIESYLDRTDDKLVAQIPSFITLGEIRCAREVKNLGLKTCVTSLFQPGKYAYLKPKNWLETISINFGNVVGFTSVSRQSLAGTKTITLASPHNFSIGSPVSVFNMGNAAYNGNYTVTAITQYSFSYVIGTDTETLTLDTGGFASPPLEERTPLLPRSLEYCNYYWQNRSQTGTPRFYADYDYNNFLIVATPQIAFPFEIVMYAQPEFLSETNQQNWFTKYSRDLLLYACLLETAPYLKDDSRVAVWQDRYDKASGATKTQDKERVNDASLVRME